MSARSSFRPSYTDLNPYGVSCWQTVLKCNRASHATQEKRRHLKGGSHMRGLKTFLGTTALLAGLALAPVAQTQIIVDLGVPPVCAYGYYDYEPYACSPYGFYGPGYFYGAVFLGMGPWAGWGYGHGWGSHRFSNGGGGSYRGGGGAAAGRSRYWGGGGQVQVMRQLRVAAEIPAAAVGMPAVAVVDMPAAAVVDMPAAAVVDMLAAVVVGGLPAGDASNL